MLIEILTKNKFLYKEALVKHVFLSCVADLELWALHDGWKVENDTLIRVTPAAEEVTGIRDKLIQDVRTSGLDEESKIEKAIEDSARDFVAKPPNFNGSITNVRVALETVARRAAITVEKEGGAPYPDDSWGKALSYLRSAGVIEKPEEEMLAKVYTFISPGAHIPIGITEEEWARLARTYGLSSAYFLLQKYKSVS